MRKVINIYTGRLLGLSDKSDRQLMRSGFKSDLGLHYRWADFILV